MNNLYKIIKQELKLSTDVIGLDMQATGWYWVRLAGAPKNNRYNVGLKKKGFKYILLIYDFGQEVMIEKYLDFEPDLELTKNLKPKKPSGPMEIVKDMYKDGIKKDNGYLKGKMLHKFDLSRLKVKNVTYLGQDNLLLVPYTNFNFFPEFIGAKLIKSDGYKFAVRGSALKGSFHPHRFSKDQTSYVLGEGLAECVVASNLLNSFNVLECGGCGNVKTLVEIILKNNMEATIYCLGENDSIDFYEKLKEQYPSIKVCYPPDKETKDFNDYYVKYGIKKTKEAMLGLELKQNSLGYKPLGIENTTPVFYSKLTNTIVKKDFNQVETVFRLLAISPETASTIPIADKKKTLDKVYVECCEAGDYSPDKILPVGLWTYGNKCFYNDGHKVLEVLPNKLKMYHYSSIIKSDFLLTKVPRAKALDIESDYKGTKELESILASCDWTEKKLSAKLLIGFLVQSYYAGSIDFRPHMWFQSLESHAGKSWLSTWLTLNLMPESQKREAGKSSVAGASQLMTDFAGLLACDEFAEQGSAFQIQARQMIELLRSAATAQYPFVMGGADGVPRLYNAKFSCLLSCIDGKDLLRKQDHDRVLFLYFGKKNLNFVKHIEPKFESFLRRELHLGFAKHAITGYYFYREVYAKIHAYLIDKYPEIGHRVRGLASCIAGYAAYYRSRDVVTPLLKLLPNSKVIAPYIDLEQNEDIVQFILRCTISERFLSGSGMKTVTELLNTSTCITPLGLKLEDQFLYVYANEFHNFNKAYLRMPAHALYTKAERIKVFC